MMLDILYKRRSIRKYKQKFVEEEKIEQLIRAALLAPSARAIYPQRFIVINDKDLLAKLSRSREHGSSFLKDAPLAVVVLGDSSLTDVWIEDTTISAIILQLEAKSLDLESCWIQIRNRNHSSNKTSEEYIQELLNIPPDIKVQCIISIGYPDEEKSQRTEQDLDFNRIHYNTFKEK